jgi:ribosomal-protein-alanine acetyltransferase
LIREASPSDLKQLNEIEQEAFPGSTWKAEDFLLHRCLVAESEGVVIGLLVSRQVLAAAFGQPAEREILNLAVRRNWQRQGIAASLLDYEMQSRSVFFLEVRESNSAARALYSKAGFRELNRRADYYSDPTEPAIVMTTARE